MPKKPIYTVYVTSGDVTTAKKFDNKAKAQSYARMFKPYTRVRLTVRWYFCQPDSDPKGKQHDNTDCGVQQ